MNRFFYSEGDPECTLRLTEVELLRTFMDEHFSKQNPEVKDKLKLFIDIHAHSGQRDIFTYAPFSANMEDMSKVRNFPAVLHNMS